MLSLRALECLVAIVKQGSLTKAAAVLHMSQPALSHQIALGAERKAALFQARSATNPARRIGTADDIAAAALMVLTNGFLTGASIPVDGGEHLVQSQETDLKG
jgi:NAD(P)-dependent dehydrogenase (short-subunit alcohol dehydrogenase family)